MYCHETCTKNNYKGINLGSRKMIPTYIRRNVQQCKDFYRRIFTGQNKIILCAVVYIYIVQMHENNNVKSRKLYM